MCIDKIVNIKCSVLLMKCDIYVISAFLLMLVTTVRIWRQKYQRSNPAFVNERHTFITPGVTFWGQIFYDRCSLLLVLQDTLMARRYAVEILKPLVRSMLSSRIGAIQRCQIKLGLILRDSHNNNYKNKMVFYGLPSSDLSPIEND